MTPPERHEIATRKILLELPGMEAIVRRTAAFAGGDGQPLPLEIYHPAGANRVASAVVIVEGYPDPDLAKFLGCRFMEMEWSVSLARLIAASGLVAVTYANREPAADLDALLDHLAAHGSELGVDASRMGVWATSGHGPLALSRLDRVACGVFSNAYLCDLTPATHVADAAATFRFAAPAPVAFTADQPLFLIRSGKDEMPGLNESIDRFVAQALALNAAITVADHPDAPHSFDLFHNSARTRHILREALDFLRATLAP